jgi:DNA helicase-2/ATP-dependent DNA helicase PcrA
MPWDEDLSDEQRVAASHTGQHARLLAGPGTGKTLALTRRVVYLVRDRHVEPERIMALTFTRAATAELKRRIRRELGDEANKVIIFTLHSYALRVILGQTAGGRLPSPIRIADDYEERWIIEEDLKTILDLSNVKEARDLLQQLSADWERLTADESGYEERFPNPAFLGAWREHRQIYGYTLRAELVYQLKHALDEGSIEMKDPPAHILVDEYQDLNACDLAVIDRVAALGAELYVAGDDDQSIYGFRYANPDGIRRFDRQYTPSASLVLEECRRCDSRILDAALYVAQQDPRRIAKRLVATAGAGTGEVRILNFRNQGREAAGIAQICEWLMAQRGVPADEILILLRSDRYRQFSDPIRGTLEAVDIPVATVSNPLEPLDSDAGRQFVSLLRLVVNSADDLAWRTLLRLRDNNIGPTVLAKLYDLARSEGIGLAQAVVTVTNDPGRLGNFGARVAKDAAAIGGMVEDAVGRSQDNLAAFIQDLAQAHIEDDELRARVVGVFARVLPVALPENLEELLRAINVSLADAEQEIEAGSVNIMTMHQAKGLSAIAVVVAAAEDEYIPGRAAGDAVDDERRLLYVSLSRARHYLFVTHCQKRTGAQMHTGRNPGHQARTLTTFLSGGPIPSVPGIDYTASLPR